MSRALFSILFAVWTAHAGAWHGASPGAPGVMYAQVAGDPGSAARQAAAMTGGRVLDVQTVAAGGAPRYQVKVLLPDGRVRVVQLEGGPTALHGGPPGLPGAGPRPPRGLNSFRN